MRDLISEKAKASVELSRANELMLKVNCDRLVGKIMFQTQFMCILAVRRKYSVKGENSH